MNASLSYSMLSMHHCYNMILKKTKIKVKGA